MNAAESLMEMFKPESLMWKVGHEKWPNTVEITSFPFLLKTQSLETLTPPSLETIQTVEPTVIEKNYTSSIKTFPVQNSSERVFYVK